MNRKLLLNSGVVKELTGKEFGIIFVTLHYKTDDFGSVYLKRKDISDNQDFFELMEEHENLPANVNPDDYIMNISDESDFWGEDTFLQIEFNHVEDETLSFLIEYTE